MQLQYRILWLLLSMSILATAGCGFHLREATKIPSDLRTLIIDSNDPYGPMSRAISEQLRLNGVSIVDTPSQTILPVLRILSTTEGQRTVSIFGDGKTAEYQLVMTLNAEVILPGQGNYPITTTVSRSFFDNPLTALAKDAEQEILQQEMREQLAQQLIRKLITIPEQTE